MVLFHFIRSFRMHAFESNSVFIQCNCCTPGKMLWTRSTAFSESSPILIWRYFNISVWVFTILSSVVEVTELSSYKMVVWPCLNSAAHLYTVESDGDVKTNSSFMAVGILPIIPNYFVTFITFTNIDIILFLATHILLITSKSYYIYFLSSGTFHVFQTTSQLNF